jgi:hypothetical protein
VGPDYVGISGNGTFGGVTVANASTNSTSDTIDVGGADVDLSAADAQALFQTTLYDNDQGMSFAFDVDNGTYMVKLHLVEQQTGFVAGDRVFDVNFEGATLLNDLDVYVAAGGTLKALTIPVEVEVTDGELNIDFVNVVSYANVRGIEVGLAEVPDTTAPVISLLGDNPMTIEVGSTFTDPGAQVTDDVDPTTTIYGVSNVNPNIIGDYTVTYNHTDAAGNPATTVVRTVHVVDTTVPVITVLGANPLMLTVGDSFVDPGAVASDNVDGDLTSSIVVGGAAVNTAVAGDYVITYNVSDSSGNAAVEKTRTVTVEASAPVPVDTFIDDNGSVFEADIEWLAATGITKGCNPPINDMYCPNDPTTRGQMAAFFHRALGSVLSVDLADANVFTDAVGSVFEADIAWLSAAGITQGCNPPQNDLYCASGLVTRGQMAAFLHRGFGSLIGTPTPSGLTFTDTATSVFEADIQWLVDAGITKGCGPDTYCPNDLVTRGQMAAFFHRAYQAAGL